MALTTLQAGRALAAIGVAVFHANIFFIPQRLYPGAAVNPLFNAGYSGVEYFFVLSGFIMLLVHERDIGLPAKLGNFLLKRVTRIYPFYWVVLFALLALHTVVPSMSDDGTLSFATILGSALLLPSTGTMIIDSAWTLSHEMLFYLVFSTLMLSEMAGGSVLFAWAAGIVLNSLVLHLPFPMSFILSPYNLLFLFGMAAAMAFRRLSAPVAWVLAIGGISVFLLVAGLSVYPWFPLPDAVRTFVLGATAATAVCGLASLESGGWIKAPAPLVFLGDASYAIYLVHGIALAALAFLLARIGITHHLPAVLTLLLIVTGAAVAGVIAHLAVERPLLALLKRRGPRTAATRNTTMVGSPSRTQPAASLDGGAELSP